MTLYLIPAWITSGLIVSRRSARRARAYIGSQAAASAASARDRSSPVSARSRAAASGGRAAAASSMKRAMTGVMRVGPGTASRCDDGRGHDRRVVVARHRAVAPRAADRDPIGREALLGDLDRVEPAAGHGHRDPAALVDGAGAADPLGALLGDPLRPDRAAGLLVGRAREQHVAAQAGDRVTGRVEAGRARLGRQQPDDAELHRDHRLHVDRAAAVDVAVGQVRRERVVAPALGRRGHDIEMGQQEQRLAARPVAAQAGVDGAASGLRFDDLGLEAGRGQHPAIRWAATSSPSGASGGGGLIDRMRMRSRKRRDGLVDRDRPGGRVDPARRRGDRRHRGVLPVAIVSATPMMKPPNIRAKTMASSSLP